MNFYVFLCSFFFDKVIKKNIRFKSYNEYIIFPSWIALFFQILVMSVIEDKNFKNDARKVRFLNYVIYFQTVESAVSTIRFNFLDNRFNLKKFFRQIEFPSNFSFFIVNVIIYEKIHYIIKYIDVQFIKIMIIYYYNMLSK